MQEIALTPKGIKGNPQDPRRGGVVWRGEIRRNGASPTTPNAQKAFQSPCWQSGYVEGIHHAHIQAVNNGPWRGDRQRRDIHAGNRDMRAKSWGGGGGDCRAPGMKKLR